MVVNHLCGPGPHKSLIINNLEKVQLFLDIAPKISDIHIMTEIQINEIDDEIFNASVAIGDLLVEVEGTVWTDELDNLWGDQVSSVSKMAYFDQITEMRVFEESTEKEHPVIALDLYNHIKSELEKNIDEEVDSVDYPVDYSPRYYDLV